MSGHLSPRATLGKMQNPVRGILHGTAAVAAAVGAVALWLRAPSWPSRVALVVFGLGLIALYTTSSLYHSVPWRGVWKGRMQRLDHAMIFVLIAASYTPVAAIALDGAWRWGTLAFVWIIAVIGVGQQALFPREQNTFGIALMTTMGWAAVAIVFPFGQAAGATAVWLLALGGVLYTGGMVMMVTGRPRLWPRVFSAHELFHVCVVVASILHFTVTWRYVIPLA